MSVGSVDVCLPMGGDVQVWPGYAGTGLNWVGVGWDRLPRQVILFSCETSQPFIRVVRERYPGAGHVEMVGLIV
jgi:hypothetical protein